MDDSLVFAASAWHVFTAFLAFVAGLAVVLACARRFGLSPWRAVPLYLWHTLFSIFYTQVVLDTGGDAIDYYIASLEPNQTFAVGTEFVNCLTHLFSYVMGFSLLGTFLVYNIFGALGLLAFDAALRSVSADRQPWVKNLATLIIVLPSVSFWSAAIGKDSIAFMATGLALWASLSLPRRFLFMLFAVVAMFMVRPHIAALLIGGIAVAQLSSSRIPLKWRLALVALSLAAAGAVVPFALDYAGLGKGGETEDLSEYIENRQGYNQEGGGSIDISQMSPPLQMFAFMYRPLPYEAASGFGFAAAMDNVVVLGLTLVGVWRLVTRRAGRAPPNALFLWFYCLSSWLLLSMVTANLGIAVRQKWMMLPMLVCLMICSVGSVRKPRRRQEALRGQAQAHEPEKESRAWQR